MIFKKYHKIRQFRDIVKAVTMKANFIGLDADGKPMYEEREKPVLTFTGTVKLHGTNAGISYNGTELKCLKRSSFVSDGHFGFPEFVMKNKLDFISEMHKLWDDHCEKGEQIIAYGEWAGAKIQKGVGISNIDPAFFVFDAKVYNPETDESKWIDISGYEFEKAYNIYDFPTFTVDIDFNNPKAILNKLVELTETVEKECPVAKQLGHSGIGEGVVWTAFWENEKYIFKTKGEKHSASKVKKIASVDPEKLASITEFVEYAVTENRVHQAMQETNADSRKQTGDVLRWLANDIIEEESDQLEANGLTWKDVAKECSSKGRILFFKFLDENF